jgi:hypothetical protein
MWLLLPEYANVTARQRTPHGQDNESRRPEGFVGA